MRGPDAVVWLVWERDHANLRAALAWLFERGDGVRLAHLAGALWPFWKEHAHYAEGRRWLELALDLGRDAPPADRLRVLTGVGTLSWYLADEAYSRQAHEQALTLAQEIGDRAAEAFQLGSLAVHASELGNCEQANARFEASLAVAREVGDPEPVVLTLHNLAHQEWSVATQRWPWRVWRRRWGWLANITWSGFCPASSSVSAPSVLTWETWTARSGSFGRASRWHRCEATWEMSSTASEDWHD